ncbi:class I SAM-dependent methyltransferase [Burkholderia sp. S171]|uniref:class I SAM-dependent methyltransferase n=1 Tax=Burkholderia sp. S171 TaxID=1641860 RepID=UPI00131E2681|nr:class I SAM-dependent methyltransferase [Burkholderia sp. S171]
MDKAEFDKFANEYHVLHARNIALSGEDPAFFSEYKIHDIQAEMKRRCLAPVTALDFGSGVGNSLPWMKKYLPATNVTCVDVSERSLDIAASRFPGQATFVPFDGGDFPFDRAQFDLAYAMCVFHHIDRAEHVRLLSELRRVLRPDGVLAIFEHNPYNPLTVRAVNTCEFDENARLITASVMKRSCHEAGFKDVRIRYRIFFPRALSRLRVFERYLVHLPLAAQYSVYASGV